jgi:hypothetical protein
MELPTLEELLKLHQSPRNSNTTAFTFLVENLAGAICPMKKTTTTLPPFPRTTSVY